MGKDLQSDHTHSPIKARRNLSKDLADVNFNDQINEQDDVTNQYRKINTTFVMNEKDVIDVSKMSLGDEKPEEFCEI